MVPRRPASREIRADLEAQPLRQRLRSDDGVGPLLVQLEEWIYSTEPRTIGALEELVRPFEGESPDALESFRSGIDEAGT